MLAEKVGYDQSTGKDEPEISYTDEDLYIYETPRERFFRKVAAIKPPTTRRVPRGHLKRPWMERFADGNLLKTG
jgi:hypothetical protein